MKEGIEAPGVVSFVERGLEAISVENAFGRVLVFRHGAHVTEYVPAGQAPVLFVSARSHYRSGKAIRGGVPLCFPWFGPHPQGAGLPAHGFARISEFRFVGSRATPAGGTTLEFSLASNQATRESWPHDFALEYLVTLEGTLRLSLAVVNTGEDAFEFEEALHSYFSVADIGSVSISGLRNARFTDQVSRRQELDQSERIVVDREVDRVYESSATCLLDDAALGRRIVVRKHSSDTTIVWNPWIEKSRSLADFGDDEYLRMVCIESGNAREARLRLAPGERHEIGVEIESMRLDGPVSPR